MDDLCVIKGREACAPHAAAVATLATSQALTSCVIFVRGERTLPPLHILLLFGLHLVFARVSWIHATFDVVAVLVLLSTISLFSPLLCPHMAGK
jgi:hypothetical protein